MKIKCEFNGDAFNNKKLYLGIKIRNKVSNDIFSCKTSKFNKNDDWENWYYYGVQNNYFCMRCTELTTAGNENKCKTYNDNDIIKLNNQENKITIPTRDVNYFQFELKNGKVKNLCFSSKDMYIRKHS
ncbi:hypothetical protein PIROE2DRAFT_11769 [Piromyces sp. E2]|nr:hypothetical protein PIROE2DRAFT_11769 [Piromyces sp. E2]|eukprot:OUM62061.1 hypothetical protein PIROE2DRAFT_11769 [Piromyces sp. E2]